MLPEIRKQKGEPQNFPTRWQSVLFRNYGYVSTDKIAAVLGCSEERVQIEAARLGLGEENYNPDWEKKGYITLIRNNWFLLPYDQLTALLGITEERLQFILEKEDFLYLKLGGFKPDCERVSYFPLDARQIEQTRLIAERVKGLRIERERPPFDFFSRMHRENSALCLDGVSGADGFRIVHGYITPCGDVFSAKNEEYLPDSLLEEYRRQGINGLWFHALLSALSFYPFDESLSQGYERRREELKRLISRCASYGIKVFLYFNEPRALPKEKIGKYASLAGRTEDGYVGFCIEKEEVKEYLYQAIKDLLTEVTGLGGIITITMSENLTHCNYRPGTNCPICKNIPPQRSAAEVNNIFMRAVRDSRSGCELIANLWGWSPFMEWNEEQTLNGVELLDRDISVMCVSEYDLEIEKGGVKSRIIDYSVGNVGPSDITVKTLKKAKDCGHKIYAKIQINNSWECSAVPVLPVYRSVYEHLENLKKIGVGNYMLTWTLGGYPSSVMRLVADFAEKGEEFSLDEWYKTRFGKNSDAVKRAAEYFSEGLSQYPFSIDSLYFSPKTLGAANLWELCPSEKQSTMVCFSFDDYETWIKPYPYMVYLSQYEKLLRLWKKGMEELSAIGEEEVRSLALYARAAYLHFQSDLLQTKFSYLKRDAEGNADLIAQVLSDEKELVCELLQIIAKEPTVGYEASNHYFYHERNLIEKYINIENIEILLQKSR